jgi:hypothetical protein
MDDGRRAVTTCPRTILMKYINKPPCLCSRGIGRGRGWGETDWPRVDLLFVSRPRQFGCLGTLVVGEAGFFLGPSFAFGGRIFYPFSFSLVCRTIITFFCDSGSYFGKGKQGEQAKPGAKHGVGKGNRSIDIPLQCQYCYYFSRGLFLFLGELAGWLDLRSEGK